MAIKEDFRGSLYWPQDSIPQLGLRSVRWPTTVTAKEITFSHTNKGIISRQKERLTAKRKTSRQKEKPHGKKKTHAKKVIFFLP